MTDARNARSATRVAFVNPTPASTIGVARDARTDARVGIGQSFGTNPGTRSARSAARVGLPSGAAPDTQLLRLARYQLRILAPTTAPNFGYNARSSLRVALVNPEHQGIGYVAQENLRAAIARPYGTSPANRLARQALRAGLVNTAVSPETRPLRVARYAIRVLSSTTPGLAPATVWVWDSATWVACPVHVWQGDRFVLARSVRVWDGASFQTVL